MFRRHQQSRLACISMIALAGGLLANRAENFMLGRSLPADAW